MRIGHRHHDLGQRLTYPDVHLAAQSQYHGRHLLGNLHALLEVLIYQLLIIRRERRQVNRALSIASADRIEIGKDAVSIERNYRRGQQSHRLEACIERLVCRELVLVHAAAPVALAVEAHVPVREVFRHKLRDGTARRGDIIIVVPLAHLLHQRVEQRDDPAVYLGSALHGHLRLAAGEPVNVRVERKE